ncbi:DNA repair and recombination protein rad54b [Umbelopsis sp. WA50703]
MRRSQAPSKRSAHSVTSASTFNGNRNDNASIQPANQIPPASAAKRQRMSELPTSSNLQRYFAIVWRKQTMKKVFETIREPKALVDMDCVDHLKYEKSVQPSAQAYMRVNGHQVTIIDDRGKELAKLSAGQIKGFDEGCEFSASGKDFEISREISEAEFEEETGQENNEDDFVPVEQTKIKRVPIPKFKAHTKLPPAPPVSHYSIQPRHDPSNPHTLILPRPSNEYVIQYNKRNRPLVDVVVDPIIGQHLRDHQREGIVFMYECLMDMKNYGGEGVLLADESKFTASEYALLIITFAEYIEIFIAS